MPWKFSGGWSKDSRSSWLSSKISRKRRHLSFDQPKTLSRIHTKWRQLLWSAITALSSSTIHAMTTAQNLWQMSSEVKLLLPPPRAPPFPRETLFRPSYTTRNRSRKTLAKSPKLSTSPKVRVPRTLWAHLRARTRNLTSQVLLQLWAQQEIRLRQVELPILSLISPVWTKNTRMRLLWRLQRRWMLTSNPCIVCAFLLIQAKSLPILTSAKIPVMIPGLWIDAEFCHWICWPLSQRTVILKPTVRWERGPI